jgi:hypothetical protein
MKKNENGGLPKPFCPKMKVHIRTTCLAKERNISASLVQTDLSCILGKSKPGK